MPAGVSVACRFKPQPACLPLPAAPCSKEEYEFTDPDTGRAYYVHPLTKKTSWEKPDELWWIEVDAEDGEWHHHDWRDAATELERWLSRHPAACIGHVAVPGILPPTATFHHPFALAALAALQATALTTSMRLTGPASGRRWVGWAGLSLGRIVHRASYISRILSIALQQVQSLSLKPLCPSCLPFLCRPPSACALQPVALAWVEVPVMEAGEEPPPDADGNQEAPAEEDPLKAMCAARVAEKAAAAAEGQEAAADKGQEGAAQAATQGVEEAAEQDAAAAEAAREAAAEAATEEVKEEL